MPHKNQTKSYRNKNGKEYQSIGDFENKALAKEELLRLRTLGVDCFSYNLSDGCVRLFVLKDDPNYKDV